jgi:hypothetical protein
MAAPVIVCFERYMIYFYRQKASKVISFTLGELYMNGQKYSGEAGQV